MMEALRTSFGVACSPERAFELWTAQTAAWWPPSHTVSGEAGLEVIIEPRVGGRIFERTARGEEHDWGEVTAWEPPNRIAYIWHLRQDRADATEVEIGFQPAEPDGTTVSITHRGWERLGARASELRERNQLGWAGVLEAFRVLADC
jgi:uncharacterized protein YndB with AHSA1/START domain